MDELRVPTNPLPVEVCCIGGQRFVGDVFMPAHSSRYDGPMRPEEWANTVPMFFPFRPYGATCRTVFNRAVVVAITVPVEHSAIEDEAVIGNPVFQVAVDAGGLQFEGRVVIDMPRTRQRVVDWLNSPSLFFTLSTGNVHHLIQKQHITRVVEIREE